VKVLIVDDDEFIRSVCERVLRAAGHAVAVAASGDEAVPRLGEGWDIVVTDMTMPGKANGLEILRRAKAAGNADVLMMTALPELDVAIQALKLGAYDFIVKPFPPEVLAASVGRCAGKRLLSDELAREKALREEQDRMRKVTETFGLFVTPEVAAYALALPRDGRRNAARRKVTVLFSDVRRFTSFAASIPPEEAVETLNEIFERVVGAVRREGGILNKFMGDGVLALFGAPLELAEQEQAAARAALAAMKAVESLAEDRQRRGLVPLRIGIAVNTGEVVAGCLGASQRTEYSVIGHAVNLAARLNGAAKPGQILFGPDTAAAVRGRFRCRQLEPMTLAGVAEPVATWQLEDELEALT
jgi:class 3 adenylate cyclase